MPAYKVLRQCEHGPLVRFLDGPLAGREVVLNASEPSPNKPPPKLTRWQKAERLLQSLLAPDQLESWRKRRSFIVPTPYGAVELGHMSDMRYWPTVGGKYRICVVPQDYKRLPRADVWAILLLWLRSDPRWVLTVANWRTESGDWNFGPVPGINISE